MATQEKTWNVANRLHSLKDSDNPEVNHIIAGADEIYDDAKGAKQSDINAQTDAALANRYTKAETYSKEQLDSLITTPDVNYVTVATFADLPQTGEADTIYRVSSYDGSQVDASKYALYAWNGTSYQLLAVRSAVGEVFDVSEYNSGATYETLASALAAVPESVQKGGMSIKFVQSTDNKYVQWRYIGTSITDADFTNVANWQGADDEPTANSNNLVKSGGVDFAINSQSIHKPYHLIRNTGDPTTIRRFLSGDFKAGQEIAIELKKFTVTGSSPANINIQNTSNSNYELVVWKNSSPGIYRATISSDTNLLQINLGSGGNIVDVEFDVLFGNSLVINSEQIKNILSLFNFKLNEIKELVGGYFSKDGYWVTSIYGGWRTAVFDVIPNEYYLVNCAIHNAVRIFDVDTNNIGSINTSVPASYYNIKSSDKTSWALVKPKYNKLGVNVIDPSTKTEKGYEYPKYVHLERTDNNGLIFLFLQIYALIEQSNKYIIVKKSGGGDYTSLTKAIMNNFGKWGVTIYLDEGEYDLLEELEEYYGTPDFISLTPGGRGIELGYDITIKASPNSVIKSHYTGSNKSMLKSFSPFNCNNQPNTGGFNLVGVRIECSRCRYVIHDEKGTTGLGSYNNLYENCDFKIDNTNNAEWSSSMCIGGGLGYSANIMIKNCMFESIDPRTPNNAAVSYHNNRLVGAKSFITCTGNYINGTRGFRFSWYGESEEITNIILQGNNVGRATTTGPETQPDDPVYGPSLIENISVKEWNSVLRT